MFPVNRTDNTISPLQKHSFKALKFCERQHLQKRLYKPPKALSDLLILQKEFAGFDNTKERLDLPALDRRGQIVVIRSKLDASGARCDVAGIQMRRLSLNPQNKVDH